MSRYTCHTRIQSVRSFTDNEWTRIARFFLFEGIIHPHVSQRVYLLFPTVWLLCVWRDWARVWADKKYRFGVRWKILLLHLYKGYECNLAHRIWTLTIQKKVSLGNPTTPRINNWSPPKRKTVGSYSALKRSRRSHYIPPWKNGSTRWKKSDSLTFEPSLIVTDCQGSFKAISGIVNVKKQNNWGQKSHGSENGDKTRLLENLLYAREAKERSRHQLVTGVRAKYSVTSPLTRKLREWVEKLCTHYRIYKSRNKRCYRAEIRWRAVGSQVG